MSAQAIKPSVESSSKSAAVTRGPDGRLNADELRRFIEVANEIRPTWMTVVLDVDWTPEGYLTEEEISAQRERVATVQSEVLDHLTRQGLAQRVRQYKYIPMLAVGYSEVTAFALDGVQVATRLVVAAPDRPATHDTREHVEADVLENTRGVDGSGWVVAVLDTGITPAHSALAGKVVAEACFSTHDPDAGLESLCFGGDKSHAQYPTEHSTDSGSAVDCSSTAVGCGHGTRVAGLIAADGTAVRGMAPGAKLIAIQVFTNVNNKASAEPVDQAAALEHVYELRGTYNIAAVNMSFGSDPPFLFSSACDGFRPAVTAAAANLRSVGILPVASAGNDNDATAISSPACISHVVAVGAVLKGVDTVWTEPNAGSNSAPLLDLWAPPGDGEISTDQSGKIAGVDGIPGIGATSAAAAVASGAIAALRSGYPGVIRNDTLIVALKNAGVSVTDPRNNVTRKRIALDLALPPTEFTVWSFCGSVQASWGGSVPNNDQYRVESSPYPFPGLWHPEWVGTETSANFSINEDKFIGVRACLPDRCGGHHEFFDVVEGPCS